LGNSLHPSSALESARFNFSDTKLNFKVSRNQDFSEAVAVWKKRVMTKINKIRWTHLIRNCEGKLNDQMHKSPTTNEQECFINSFSNKKISSRTGGLKNQSFDQQYYN